MNEKAAYQPLANGVRVLRLNRELIAKVVESAPIQPIVSANGEGDCDKDIENSLAFCALIYWAEKTLGIDSETPESAEAYTGMDMFQFCREAEAAGIINRLLQDGISPATIARAIHAQQNANAKRGGPHEVPTSEQLRIVKGWLTTKGRMTKERYAGRQGIDRSTLSRWEKKLRKAGLL